VFAPFPPIVREPRFLSGSHVDHENLVIATLLADEASARTVRRLRRIVGDAALARQVRGRAVLWLWKRCW
jgi:hypothetical protein